MWPDSFFMLAALLSITRKQILMAALLTTMCALRLIVYYYCVRVARYIFQMTLFISMRVARVEILIIPACVIVAIYILSLIHI